MKLPDPLALAELPLHVIVRDFPETLVVFLRAANELPLRGGESLAEVFGPAVARVCQELRGATAWRDAARPGRCERAAAQAAARRASALAAESVAPGHADVRPPT